LMQQLAFDRYDYVAFKYLTLFDTSIYSGQCGSYRDEVHGMYNAILYSWSEYRHCVPSAMPLLDVLHRFREIASKAMEFLKQKSQSGEAKLSKLLAEMLTGLPVSQSQTSTNYQSNMKSIAATPIGPTASTASQLTSFYNTPSAVRH